MSSGKRAFTLVELLVVISIISLLMAILVPALSKSRILARRMVCASRLQQLGVALIAYGNSDDKGRLPESNGYTCKYIPMSSYKLLRAILPKGSENVFVCPEYTLFKEQNIKELTDPALNRKYRWEPFPSSYDDGKGMWIGYFYLGGRDLSRWDWRFIPPDAHKWVSPRTVADSGKLPLVVDLIEQANGEWFWTEAVHRKGGWSLVYTSGGVEPEDIDTDGGNSLHMDGSVVWTSVKKMKKYPRSQPGSYRSFGYWYWPDH